MLTLRTCQKCATQFNGEYEPERRQCKTCQPPDDWPEKDLSGGRVINQPNLDNTKEWPLKSGKQVMMSRKTKG